MKKTIKNTETKKVHIANKLSSGRMLTLCKREVNGQAWYQETDEQATCKTCIVVDKTSRKTKGQLIKEIEELKEQIQKMKCCSNCNICGSCYRYSDCVENNRKYWELEK